jgi:hypothetical protein
MLRFDPAKVLANARQAQTDDLLDRVTVLRAGMEPEALEVLEAELARRGLGPDEIRQHELGLKHRVVQHPDGLPARCSFCARAAVECAAGWQRLLKLVPLFRRTFYYCEQHWGEHVKK